MIGFGIVFISLLGSFIIPALVAFALVTLAKKYIGIGYLAAFTIGIYLWFFTDTLGGANYLDVNEGYGGGVWQFVIWALFVIGLVAVFALDRDIFTQGPPGERFGFAVPLIIALAIGIHGAAEGGAIGASAATTTSTNLLDAFGGLSAAVAFLLHKGLEPTMMAVAYWAYAKDHAKNGSQLARDIVLLSVVFAIPGIIGGTSVYFIVQSYPNIDLSYVYGLGVGTSVYALVRLARPLFQNASSSPSYSTKVAIAAAIGFTFLYLAALLHS